MNKILLVDDEPIIVMLFKTILESKGYAVSVALTGEEGLKMAKEINPGLIILDYHLPGLNGKEVYYKLKQNPKTKKIPIVFCTANLYEEDIGKLKSDGCQIFEKPVNTKAFLKKINSLLPLIQPAIIVELF